MLGHAKNYTTSHILSFMQCRFVKDGQTDKQSDRETGMQTDFAASAQSPCALDRFETLTC